MNAPSRAPEAEESRPVGNPASTLFRLQAVAHASRRLDGEVILAAPPSARLLAPLLCAIVAAAVLLASLGTYARKATVAGWIVPDQGMIRATAQAGGLVRQVFVREGDPVEAGARLAEIQIAAETQEGNAGRAVADGLRAEAEALRARAQAALSKLEAEAEQSGRQVEAIRRELAQVRAQVSLQEERVRLARTLVSESERLAAKGFLARRELENRQNMALAVDQDLAGKRREAGALERQLSDVEARIAAIPLELALVRAEAGTADASLRQRMAEAEARRVQYVLAPLSGRVAALPATAGQSIAAGSALAVIIPQDGKLEAQLLAPSRAIGFIRSGLEVRLMLQAFPHERFGTLHGTVEAVSNTVLGPGDIAIPGLALQEPVFRVRVNLSHDAVGAYGETFPLQPGMLLSADIILDRRSLIEWLFDPLFAVGRRSG